MNKTAKPFFVPRTATRKSGNADEQGSHPLENYSDLPAYVLLGDPGAGKTRAFEEEADESGGTYIKARDFATFELKEEDQDKTLFIDALDEMRADGGDGWTAIAQVSKHLEELGCPSFRLSCREADWLGDGDSAILQRISPDIVALHLDPLTDNDIIEILRHKNVSGSDEFVRKANDHRLGELLRNPQVLNLLVDALAGDEWPQSRKDIYEMACQKLVREESRAHRDARRGTHPAPDALLDAAGYLCAIHLLSGIAGFALDEDAADDQHYYWNRLSAHGLPLHDALRTKLFQQYGEERRIPVHRSVAEFLGARHLAAQIENDGLPFGRALALIAGEDGGVTPDLRGLAAWLSVHCPSGRRTLIERDPLGVVLYGDVRNFVVDDKRRLLNALKNEAQRYPWFRSQDMTSPPFGALGTVGMEPAFREILTSPSRAEADQALLDCVLDAIRFGERLSALDDSLEAVVRDASFWPTIRQHALKTVMSVMPDVQSKLLKLLEGIRAGAIEDDDEVLLGALLSELYPQAIAPSQLFGYLHPVKKGRPIGGYSMFWGYELPRRALTEDLPQLLDDLVQTKPTIQNALEDHRLFNLTGELLGRGLEEHGDLVSDERLYAWLGIGLDEYDHPRLDREYTERIAAWFAHRPERYKALIEYAASLSLGQEKPSTFMYKAIARLYGATLPTDIGMWYISKAADESNADLSQFYFFQTTQLLRQQGGQSDLTLPALEFLESWAAAYPKFKTWLEWHTTCPIGEWQQKHAIEHRTREAERRKQKSGWIDHFRQHIAAIRDGSAYPQIFYHLALVHDGLSLEAHGDTPYQLLEDFLGGNKELIEAAYSGFRRVLERGDLPGVGEIVDLELKGKMHFIRPACLIGMDELYLRDPDSALALPDGVLSRLLAFRLSYSVGNDPLWFTELAKVRPDLVAEVLLAYVLPMLRAKKEHVSGVSQLSHNDDYAAVARMTLPKLLEGFPLRASTNQLAFMLAPLLKSAMHYLGRETLAPLVARKLKLRSMDVAQRVYWLSCGLLLAPEIYESDMFQYVGKSAARRGYMANFLYNAYGERSLPDWACPPETALAHLIELLAPDCVPERPDGEAHWVTPAMHTAEMLLSFTNKLGNNPQEFATRELERLLALPGLAHWHNQLRGALHTQRITRRKATFQRLSVEQISQTLANIQPASAADLAALAFHHLRDIAEKIRNGSTNDYRQYWSFDSSNKPDKPKPENDCRDALLSDLQDKLGALNIAAEREGNYADDKRADIKVSFGGASGFNVPIEIKKDTHDNLWRAIHEQLIQKYVRDPGADGYGIYLVFWFGGKGMKPPIDGKKLHSPAELEERLRQTLTPEESYRIRICVIDCALS